MITSDQRKNQGNIEPKRSKHKCRPELVSDYWLESAGRGSTCKLLYFVVRSSSSMLTFVLIRLC